MDRHATLTYPNTVVGDDQHIFIYTNEYFKLPTCPCRAFILLSLSAAALDASSIRPPSSAHWACTSEHASSFLATVSLSCLIWASRLLTDSCRVCTSCVLLANTSDLYSTCTCWYETLHSVHEITTNWTDNQSGVHRDPDHAFHQTANIHFQFTCVFFKWLKVQCLLSTHFSQLLV